MPSTATTSTAYPNDNIVPDTYPSTIPDDDSSRVRLYIFFQRQPELSVAAFEKYWREDHARTALALPIFTRNLLAYR